MLITVICNGKPERLDEGTTIKELVDSLDLGRIRYAVELNGKVVRQAEHEATSLNDQDELNIVTFVGGG